MRLFIITFCLWTSFAFADQITINDITSNPTPQSMMQDVDANFTELYDKIAIADTTNLFWDNNDTDGTFNAIELPTGVECKSVLIQVINPAGIATEDPIPFHYSSTGNETQNFTSHISGLVINIKKDSGTLGYIRAIAGYKVAVFVLD